MTDDTSREPPEVRILRALAEHAVEYVLIGALPARLQGYPGLTEDVDISPRREIGNWERLADALNELDARLLVAGRERPGPFEEQDFFEPRPQSFVSDAGRIDVVPFATGVGDIDDLAPSATTYRVFGVEVRVAALDDVIASKEAAGRPKDLQALPLLYLAREKRARRAPGP